MSDLLNILDARAEEICRAFDESIDHTECPTLAATRAGSSSAIFEALCACCRRNDDVPAQAWAKAVRDEAAPRKMPFSEVLNGLSRLEQVIRFHIVKTVEQKTVLLLTLADLNDAMDRLRRSCVELHAARGPVAAGPMHDLVTLANRVDTFICMATLHGKPFYLNFSGRRMIGLGEDQPLPSGSLHDFYAEPSWQELRDVAVPAVKEHGRWEGQSRLRNAKTGRLVDMLTTMLLVKHSQGDKPPFLAILHTDAGDQIRLE